LTFNTQTCLSGRSSRKLSALSLLIFSPLFILAQLGGIWYGELENDSTHKKQNFELGLSEYRGKITGFTYTTFIENDTFYYSIKRIKAEKKDGLLIITDDEMVGNNFPERAAKRVKQTTTFPLINDSTIDITKGSWTTNRTKKYYSLTGSAQVQELEDRNQSDLVAHLEEMKVRTAIATRKPQKKIENPVVQTAKPVNKPEEKKPDVVKEQSSTLVKNQEPTQNKPSIKKDEPVSVQANKIEKPVVQTATPLIKPEEKKPDVVKEQSSIIVKNPEPTQNKPSIKKDEPVFVQTNEVEIKPTAQPVNTKPSTPNNTVAAKPIITEPKVANQNTAAVQPIVQKTEPTVINNNKPETQKVNPRVAQTTTVPITSKKDEFVAKPLPSVVTTRKSETIQNLYFHGDSLVLSLYDNGMVDGDTVSVFFNGNPIISKQQLKVSAFKKTIYITPEMDSVELVLFADNLGSIPPNTGLLTVRDGDQTFNVRFSADLQKNASIVLTRKK